MEQIRIRDRKEQLNPITRPTFATTKPASAAPATDIAAHLNAVRAALPAEESPPR